MLSWLLACGLLGSPANLVINPGFESGLDGWAPFYTREAGAGEIQTTRGPGDAMSVVVRHRGTKDWAFSQAQSVKIEPDNIYALGGEIKIEGTASAGLSVVARRSDGTVIDWSYARAALAGPNDWKHVQRRFVPPPQCSTVQFRLEGSGAGVVSLANPTLTLAGAKPSVSEAQLAGGTLETKSLRLRVKADGSWLIDDRRSGKEWVTHPLGGGMLVEGIHRAGARSLQLKISNIESNAHYDLVISVDAEQPEIVATLQGNGDLERNVDLPAGIRSQAGQWLIVPMNEGILFPTDDATVPTFRLVTYSGHGICMPWWGLCDPKSGAGVMTIVETPDDAALSMDRRQDLLEAAPSWEPSRGALRYPRVLRLVLLDSGGYVGMAKRYRTYAKAHGLWVPLKDKQKHVPAVDRLVGAMNVWNWDMDAASVCREMKDLGIGRVLWSRGGNADELRAITALGYLPGRYDIFQDVWDPKIALTWMPTAGWPSDLVLLRNGDWMHGWAHPDRQADGSVHWLQGGVICSEPGLARAKLTIPEDLKTHPYLARFIDTTTASPWRECYNPKHPLTRSDDRHNKMALLDFCSKDLGMVVGTETGIDPSVPHVDYYEGMLSLGPFRLPDAGTDMIAYRKPTPDFLKYQVGSFYRLPLWELVYHDCTVAQWYWGDASNKAPEVWDQRDLINILYGTPPLIMFDKAKWASEKERIVKTYKDVCNWTRTVGYDEMTSHEFLTADHSVQRTRFASGKSVIVNFGDKPWMGLGKTVPSRGHCPG